MKKERKKKCECPIYCKYDGSKLKRDTISHLCPMRNCQWEFGVDKCKNGWKPRGG